MSLLVAAVHLFTAQPVVVRAASQSPLPQAPENVSIEDRPEVASRPILAPAKAPNRTLPVFNAPQRELRLSDSPTDQEIASSGVFAEPLAPIGGATTAEDNKAASTLLQAVEQRSDREDLSTIHRFVASHPKSPWRASLLFNAGLEYRRLGYFSKALETWQEAWKRGKGDTSPKGRALMDRAAGELAELNARLGRYDWLEAFFKEIADRNIQGSATEKIAGARQGLWLMRNKPEAAFRCGPMALDRIRAFKDPSLAFDAKVLDSKSTLKGMSLTEVNDLARQLGMDYVLARREPGASMAGVVPAVVHWKVGHYAALTGEREGRYRVEDPTFGDPTSASQRAIDAEASGHFLIPKPAGGKLPKGWTLLSAAQGRQVWGKGNTGQSDPNRTRCDDVKVKGGTDCVPCGGMAQYDVHAMLVSLNIGDSPLGYTPPRGMPITFTARYSQREANQPANFTYSNLGQKWTHHWLSYVQDSSISAETPPVVYLPGGGAESYPQLATDDQGGVLVPRVTYWYDTSTNPAARYVETAEYKPQQESRAVLVKTSRNAYEKRYPDGSKDVFLHRATEASVVHPRKIFLSKQIDAVGNETTYTYDSSHRLRAVSDALSQVTTLYYEHPTDSLKITRIEDPFSRSALFEYNPAGQLAKITDAQGLTSEFTYGAGDFIETLTTGYGTTRFAKGENGINRWLEVTDPQGDKERTEFLQAAPGIPYSEPDANVPQSIPTFNLYLNYRNTFYFSKKAYGESFNGTSFDYTRARLYHWLHTADINVCAGILESTKEAYENRVWLAYPGQSQPHVADATMLTKPALVARVMDDGATQTYRYEYNDFGKITQSVDPLGRETTLVYYPNGIDLQEVRQKRGATTDLLSSYTYFPNKLPETITDASGQTTTFTYNGFGQPGTIEDALGHVTTFAHDPEGYLKQITGPRPAATLNLEYDGYGRVRQVRNSDNDTVDTEYDALNRPTRVSYPDGSYAETLYDLLNVQWKRDRLGRWTRIYFNAIRQVVGVEDPEYQFTGYDWCRCGDLRQITDPLGRVTAWKHDAQGRVTAKLYPDKRGETYAYEPKSGRLATVTDAMEQQTKYQYYADNALKQVQHTSPTRAGVQVDYVYEVDYPRLATMTDATGVTSYGYHPVTAPATVGATRLQTVDGPLANDTISYNYDELGRSNGQAIDGVASSLHYDDLGRVDSVTNALGTFGYIYEGVSSRLSSIDIPNGQQTTFGYHPNSGDRALANITHAAPGGGIISKFDYGYSAPGRIGEWTQQQGSQPAVRHSFGYDNIDQLRAATLRDAGTQSVLKRYGYDYDSAGNRTGEQIDNMVATERPNNLNQLVRRSAGGRIKVSGALTEPAAVTVNGVPAAVDGNNQFEGSAAVTSGGNQFDVTATDGNGNSATQRYQVNVPAVAARTQHYDLNGNLTDSPSDSQLSTTYEWDAANRLTAINSGTKRSEFIYNGSNLRVKIVEKANGAVASTKQFLWEGMRLAEERDTSSSGTRRYFAQGEGRIGGTAAGLYYYARDHLGSVREITDGAGTLRARYEYDPWGVTTKLTGNSDIDFGYTGHYRHAMTGLYLAPYRAYDPSIGRWLNRDPIGERGGLNLYGYVENKPVNFVDPLGLASLVTDQTNGLTIFNPNPEQPGPLSIYPSRSGVVPSSLPGAAGPYNSGNVYPVEGPYKSNANSYGPNDILKTDDGRGRWLHGGGSGLTDPSAPRQGWYPTHGCTRLQNDDIQDLVDRIRDFKNGNPGVKIPYTRYGPMDYSPFLTVSPGRSS